MSIIKIHIYMYEIIHSNTFLKIAIYAKIKNLVPVILNSIVAFTTSEEIFFLKISLSESSS